ncbi:uncharacterized protein LOC110101456 [Dendrobium catenatum]|uniref:RBR-type E3 ubiquitin transferase n=1 Tax=Dendrobium catenatum TaxID=906689 RepID=A0A2I0VPC0_9ASPA|nr:uncharacterized protein LOC110101456 [Dendrobium catenatum]PKU65242.1 hypothetical protein MA16_Dca015953 [Dendrobium catenatum]
MDEISEFDLLVANQHRELMAASAAESDLDLAFRLQMEEALAASASASLSPPSCSSFPDAAAGPSSSAAASIKADVSHALELQSLELDHYQLERRDSELCGAELRRVAEDLRCRAHDERFAREIQDMPDEDWDEYGDNFERPIELLSDLEEMPFRLYFKGMARAELVHGASVQLAGIGVAICDPRGDLLLKIQKPVPAEGANREALDAKALLEGLNAIVVLGIKNVNIYFEFRPLLNHVIGKWRAKQQKIVNLVNQVQLLRRKLDRCQMFLLPRGHVKFVFKLVRDVIDSQITKGGDLIKAKTNNNLMETCNICLEITDCSQIFSIVGCGHRFCFSCMRQHVEVKLLHGMLPNCPHLGCNIKLEVESSGKFLTPRLLAIMCQRIKEESIPPNEKIYCPYPRCSALMSTSEAISPLLYASVADNAGLRKCIKCSGLFCINCKVPWHERMSCSDYKRSNPHQRPEDLRLHSLAKQKLWRQCVKCKHMIELSEGCFHMTCRCGYEFCYTCGAEWKDKKATCSCPLWDEQYIWYDDSEEEESEDDYYDDDDDFYDDDDDDEYDDAF